MKKSTDFEIKICALTMRFIPQKACRTTVLQPGIQPEHLFRHRLHQL